MRLSFFRSRALLSVIPLSLVLLLLTRVVFVAVFVGVVCFVSYEIVDHVGTRGGDCSALAESVCLAAYLRDFFTTRVLVCDHFNRMTSLAYHYIHFDSSDSAPIVPTATGEDEETDRLSAGASGRK